MKTAPEHHENNVVIRKYQSADETEWVRTRVLAFLDTSYRDDVQPYRERYENPAIRLVAIDRESQKMVGLIDVEYEQHTGEVCNLPGQRGGVIWHLAVLPEFRNSGIANALFQRALAELKEHGVTRLAVWTQDDEPANSWYRAKGFEIKHCYLNVFSRGLVDRGPIKDLLPSAAKEWNFGHIRNLNFEADVSHRELLEALSYRIHEVRGMELQLSSY
ncbi:GNAT family N-acetyltransferase [uncultured Rothia sp.]|uniref:GNAT family N-acetyltransferase n=1 Tax=uncultured Rothia sp. TaxID=316088 RepID=UPI00321620AB